MLVKVARRLTAYVFKSLEQVGALTDEWLHAFAKAMSVSPENNRSVLTRIGELIFKAI